MSEIMPKPEARTFPRLCADILEMYALAIDKLPPKKKEKAKNEFSATMKEIMEFGEKAGGFGKTEPAKPLRERYRCCFICPRCGQSLDMSEVRE